jgi:hypothetical protein
MGLVRRHSRIAEVLEAGLVEFVRPELVPWPVPERIQVLEEMTSAEDCSSAVEGSRAEMGQSALEGGEAAFVMGSHTGLAPFVLHGLQEVSK